MVLELVPGADRRALIGLELIGSSPGARVLVRYGRNSSSPAGLRA
jgi:hypothetical protein